MLSLSGVCRGQYMDIKIGEKISPKQDQNRAGHLLLFSSLKERRQTLVNCIFFDDKFFSFVTPTTLAG